MNESPDRMKISHQHHFNTDRYGKFKTIYIVIRNLQNKLYLICRKFEINAKVINIEFIIITTNSYNYSIKHY